MATPHYRNNAERAPETLKLWIFSAVQLVAEVAIAKQAVIKGLVIFHCCRSERCGAVQGLVAIEDTGE